MIRESRSSSQAIVFDMTGFSMANMVSVGRCTQPKRRLLS